jgi:SAM-dependent methyltransferase
MIALDPVCRIYQSLFHHNHPEEARLVSLHHNGEHEKYLRAYFDHEYEKGVTSVSRFEKLTPGRNWGESLDFGCGAGGLTYRIAEKSERTTGIDLDPEKIGFGRCQALRVGTTNVDFVCYDGGDVPLPDESFDTIVCVDVVEHLPNPERFVAEFKRLLKPGGMLYVSFGPPWAHAHGKHMWARLPGWWTHLLFPTSTCMRVSGFDPKTTWEDLGMFRLTVGRFERMMAASGLETVHQKPIVGMKPLRLVGKVPGLRELVIGEVEGVYRKA